MCTILVLRSTHAWMYPALLFALASWNPLTATSSATSAHGTRRVMRFAYCFMLPPLLIPSRACRGLGRRISTERRVRFFTDVAQRAEVGSCLGPNVYTVSPSLPSV